MSRSGIQAQKQGACQLAQVCIGSEPASSAPACTSTRWPDLGLPFSRACMWGWLSDALLCWCTVQGGLPLLCRYWQQRGTLMRACRPDLPGRQSTLRAELPPVTFDREMLFGA